MYSVDVARAMKSETLSVKTIINELDFLRKTVIIHWNSQKNPDSLLLANKLMEEIPDPLNAKEHYQSRIRKKNTKSVEITETFENPNIVDIKSVITEHPETSHKLSKTIRQAEKLGSNSSWYSDTKKWKFFKRKKCKK